MHGGEPPLPPDPQTPGETPAQDMGATQVMQAWVKSVKEKKSIGPEINRAFRSTVHRFRAPSAWRRP